MLGIHTKNIFKVQGKILIVDDNEDVLLSLNLLLKNRVEAVRVTTQPQKIEQFMEVFQPDVILLDMNFQRDAISGEEGYAWLKTILRADPDAVVLFITAYVNTEKAVRAIKEGAVDFIPKPWDRDKLLSTVESAVELSKARHQKRPQEQEREASLCGDAKDDEPLLIGESDAMKELRQKIGCVAVTDANVLVTGENGTGKDVVARLLHHLSKRAARPFVAIDLGALPEQLFESELFGYEKGAFTDAKTAKAGLVETADGGTLFLDEIGNMTAVQQQKLLTVIEKRYVARLGATKGRNVDVRLVCATNAPLAQMVRERKFRQDLLYRINTIELHLPPLRERGNDILLLANHFVKHLAEKYDKRVPALSADACAALLRHEWQGNVRELQHVMERCVILCDKAVIGAEDILLENTGATSHEASAVPASLNLDELERQAIHRAISLSNGNLTQAAEMLGITRYSLYRKIDKLGVI